MKKFYSIFCFLFLSGFFFCNLHAQEKQSERKVYISYFWSHIESHGSNQIAIWIEDTKGNLICTLFATRFTASGGYIKRPVSLSEWTAKVNLKNAPKTEVDAITAATPQTGKQSLVWDCKDKTGKTVPNASYIVRMEANILDADKMFFKGVINIGNSDQQTKGEITFSSPGLEKGNVLFKDVLVEYK